MGERVAVSEPTLQGAGDDLQRLRQQSGTGHRRLVTWAMMEGDRRALCPVTRQNVQEWASVLVTRDGPKHLWGTEWKLSRECGADLAAWFLCVKGTRWRVVERVLLFAWLSGTYAEPPGSEAPLHQQAETAGRGLH